MMRARGAKVTDIVVLVVAADDGVMPQTRRGDRPRPRRQACRSWWRSTRSTRPTPTRTGSSSELSDRGLMPEDWGGDTVMVPVSALKRQGIDELLEMILLTADILELKANPELAGAGRRCSRRARRSAAASSPPCWCRTARCKVGDVFVSGATWGRVRSMIDDRGKRVTGGRPVDPGRGHRLQRAARRRRPLPGGRRTSRRRAASPSSASRSSASRELAPIQAPALAGAALQPDPGGRGQGAGGGAQGRRAGLARSAARRARPSSSTDEGQGQGAPRAASAPSPPTTCCSPRPRRRSSSASTSAPSATPPSWPRRKASTSACTPSSTSCSTSCARRWPACSSRPSARWSSGRAEVRETFKVPKVGTIAGCHVVEGVIPRSASVRLLRDNRVVYEGKIASLRRFKDDASEVRSRLRLRHRPRALPGRQAGRHHRGLRARRGRAGPVRRVGRPRAVRRPAGAGARGSIRDGRIR